MDGRIKFLYESWEKTSLQSVLITCYCTGELRNAYWPICVYFGLVWWKCKLLMLYGLSFVFLFWMICEVAFRNFSYFPPSFNYFFPNIS